MKVRGFRWVGVGCEDMQGVTRFLKDVLGLRVIKKSRTGAFIEFEMASGQRIELFGPKSRHYELHRSPVVAFQVDDIDEARNRLKIAGVQILTGTARAKEASWFYFRISDGQVFEIQQWHTKKKAHF